MIAQHYKDMLGAKSVIRQISEWSTARGAEIGYENVFDYSLGNPSVPAPQKFTDVCLDLLEHVDPVTLHGYTPTLTLPDVRAKVAESLNRRFGMDYTGDHIFMTTGAAGALAHAVRCIAVPGQNIVTPSEQNDFSESQAAPRCAFSQAPGTARCARPQDSPQAAASKKVCQIHIVPDAGLRQKNRT